MGNSQVLKIIESLAEEGNPMVMKAPSHTPSGGHLYRSNLYRLKWQITLFQ